MSLSTLLEAAKYLDYLDSNNHQNQNQQQQQLQFQSSSHPTNPKKSNRRSRFSKKNAANTMLAMSLPSSSGPMQIHSVPIPLNSGAESHQATSLSSSFTTGSPLSSFASTALFCSKASGVTSASSSAASSLSSSDSSSSCGEILMGDNDFNQSTGNNNVKNNKKQHSNNNHHNYHLIDQQNMHHRLTDQKSTIHKFIANNSGNNNNNQSVARYIAATSTGPQLVTMTTSSSIASTSAPVDGNIRAGHVIHAANAAGAFINASPGTSFDPRHAFSLATSPGMHHRHPLGHCSEGQSFNVATAGSFGSENQLSGSPTSCPPLIMARVQPMILNSISPSAHHSIMAFQPGTASSPTSSSSSYSRHRELHKTLEKNRRAHLRHCFELLKAELPASECVDKKTSHINIIRSAIGYVLTLRQQEVEIDNELQRLTKIKNELTENLSKLRITQPMQQDQEEEQQQQQNQTILLSVNTNENNMKQEFQKAEPNSPAPEQQLSFLLSQSKID